ncbi:MAG: TonB-dependent receptor [Sphingobacteriales bacterium]|nr:MAG: TonB-dependent receptor [Sphingobacteriales bacterium]
MNKLLIIWVLLSLSFVAKTQTVTIRDYLTRDPLESVTLMSENPQAFATTNTKGQTELAAFQDADSIYIRHVRYEEMILSFRQLESMNFLVELKETNIALEEITISSNRWEQVRIKTPNRIEAINMKEAAFQNPQTTADLLGMSGYAFIQKSQLGGGSPMLRGMATNRVLLVIDGVRMNTAIFRAGNLQNVISLDANAIESSEILFGPGSVMYGSDAIGGVMSFNTLEPEFAVADHKSPQVKGNAMTRFSSANKELTAHLDLNIGLKKFAFTTSCTYSDYGDLRSGSKGGVPYFYRPHYVMTIDDKDYMVPNNDSTLQVGSKYNQINLMQKVRYQPNKYLDLEYGFHFSETSSFNRYDRLYVMQTSGPYKNKLRWAEWYYGPQKWQMHRLGFTYSGRNLFFDKFRLVAAYQFFEESRNDREFMFRELMTQKETVDASSVNFDLEKEITASLSISYGLESIYNQVNSEAKLTHVVTNHVDSTVTRYPDGSTWQSYGAYISAKLKPHPKWMFSSGLRYNHFFIDAVFDTTFFPFPFTTAKMKNGSVSGSLGFVYTPVKTWQVYMNGATGFRAPNIDDMGKVFESVPGYLVVPNPNLRPEQVFNAEIGTVKTFGSVLKLDATAYYTWLVDAMVRQNFELNGDTTIRYLGNKSRIQAVQNVTKIQVYGIQAGVDFYFKGFGIRSNISFQSGREQSSDSLIYYPLRHAAPTFGSTHVTYEHRKFKVDFYVIYNAKMDYENLALTERVNASYARDEFGRAYVDKWHTLNFKAAYYPSRFITLSLGLENINDKMYRPYASGINAPGRNLIASLRVKF